MSYEGRSTDQNKTPKTQRKLVVDDEPVVLRMIGNALSYENYEVIQADSADAALKTCEVLDDEVSLLISDISMPGMNGRDLARSISQARPDMAVILMSGTRP